MINYGFDFNGDLKIESIGFKDVYLFQDVKYVLGKIVGLENNLEDDYVYNSDGFAKNLNKITKYSEFLNHNEELFQRYPLMRVAYFIRNKVPDCKFEGMTLGCAEYNESFFVSKEKKNFYFSIKH